MFLVVENVLTQVIEDRLNYLKANPSVIDDIFAPTNADQIKSYLLNNQINVVRGFPRDPSALPAYAIVLGAEREEPESIGQYIGDDETLHEEMYGTLSVAQYRIETWTNNGDLTVLLYHLLKWMMLSQRDYLESEGLKRQSYTASDLEPVQTQFPELIYRRALNIEITYEVRWNTSYGTITKIVDQSDFA